MNTVKPITLCELQELTSKVKLTNSIVDLINKRLKENAEKYSVIAGEFEFKHLVQNPIPEIKVGIFNKVKQLYPEFEITMNNNRIFIKEKDSDIYTNLINQE